MSKRPLIGVTGPVKGGFLPWIMTRLAIWRAGGRGIRLTTASAPKINFDLIKGIVLGGGSDIDPENYGEEILDISDSSSGHFFRDKLISIILLMLRILFSLKATQPKQDSERDELEKELCLKALKKGIPILGICRGAQMLNICLGGTLHQETSEFYTETPHMRTILPRKKVFLKNKSLLQSLIGVESCFVNSLHNQAINCLGQGLMVTAYDENGIIQGIESESGKCIAGVQWHPEYLPQSERQQNLFKGLVKESLKLSSSPTQPY